MKTDDIKKLTAKTISEMEKEIVKIQSELVDQRMQKATNKNKNVREYKLLRHDLARIKTVLRQKVLEEKAKPASKQAYNQI